MQGSSQIMDQIDPGRRTGRTTATIFRALAESCTPGRQVAVVFGDLQRAINACSTAARLAGDFVDTHASRKLTLKNQSQIHFVTPGDRCLGLRRFVLCDHDTKYISGLRPDHDTSV